MTAIERRLNADELREALVPFLGKRVGLTTIDRWVHTRGLPYHRHPGGPAWRQYLLSEVVKWLNSDVETIQTPAASAAARVRKRAS